MKTNIIIRSTCKLSLAIVVATFLQGCASVQSRWQDAQRQNSAASYETFIREYPNSPFANQARERLAEVRFEQAKRAGTMEAYERYLKDFPAGGFSDKARDAIAKLARAHQLEAAQKAESVAAVEEFLKQYPQGSDAEQLRQGLPALRDWEPRKKLGELVTKLCPEVEGTQFAGNYRVKPSPTYNDDLAEIRRLLETGVNPNMVKIGDYKPREENSHFATNPKPGVLFNFSTSFSRGSRGQAVRPEADGMTLLDYCTTNKLTEAYELLKSHGGK